MSSSSKSVRFAANTDNSSNKSRNKRPYNDGDDDDDEHNEKVKRFRANEDEMDDVDEWRKEDDDDNQDNDGIVPSEHDLLEAKRRRRQKRTEGVDGTSTTIDDTTSLATEGIAIEPFHMRREESDGAGYFDGDTYVWRKNDPNETPDAWLDSLNDDANNNKSSSAIAYSVPKAARKEREPLGESMDDLSKEQLYKKILPLISGTETITQAVRRYGKICKQNQQRKNDDGGATSSKEEAYKAAKTCLDELTGCANALLLKGEVDIYDTRRQTILSKHVPLTEFTGEEEEKKIAAPQQKQPPADWEYMGNQDGKIHGPYTTEQMMGWMKAGYFVGQQKVKIRTIRKKELSTEEDLLNDLMDDDEEEEDRGNNSDVANTIKGDWQWSDEINMASYLG